jgi:hypothetical protein
MSRYYNVASLSWAPVTGATSYEVWRAVDDGPFVLLSTTGVTSAYVSPVTGTNHIKVRAVLVDGASAFSEVHSAVRPANPTNLAASSPAPGEVHFQWDPAVGANSYQIERYGPDGGWTFWQSDPSVDEIGGEGWYYYHVYAISADGYVSSGTDYVSTWVDGVAPPVLTAGPHDATTMTLEWTAVARADRYHVFQDLGAGPAWIAEVPADVLTWTGHDAQALGAFTIRAEISGTSSAFLAAPSNAVQNDATP